MGASVIDGVDAIYVINLDSRLDRLCAVEKAFSQYGVHFSRFPAVRGRSLSMEQLRSVAFSGTAETCGQRWLTTPAADGALGYTWLTQKMASQPVMSQWMSIGAVGCALSHLAVLQQAYDNGDETIWVLEDDIVIHHDPHMLSSLIQRLDRLTDGSWDILYTDYDDAMIHSFKDGASPWWLWRPGYTAEEIFQQSKYEAIDFDFVHIGSRCRTHSMIIRRSGMKKLLDHIKMNALFLPIDHEIAFARGICLYMLSYPLVTYNRNGDSDIQNVESFVSSSGDDAWNQYKKNILEQMSLFTGWCSAEKASCLMDFVYCHRPNLCVEIGAFGGSTSYPLAASLKFLNQGILHAVDAWSNAEAVRGLSSSSPNYASWSAVDLKAVKKQFERKLHTLDLTHWCMVVQAPSLKRASTYEDESIDMLYVDGNFSKKGSLKDLKVYFPKVKPGGYIWLNDAHAPSKWASVAYLMEHARFLPEESLRNECALFQKAN